MWADSNWCACIAKNAFLSNPSTDFVVSVAKTPTIRVAYKPLGSSRSKQLGAGGDVELLQGSREQLAQAAVSSWL
jgi:hypothetical protein